MVTLSFIWRGRAVGRVDPKTISRHLCGLAADILNVSRGFVLRLIEKGELPARMVGTHRRIRLEDTLAYKDKADAVADKALDELVAIEQDLELD